MNGGAGRRAVGCANKADSGSVNLQCWDDLKARKVNNASSVNCGSASGEQTHPLRLFEITSLALTGRL